MLQKNHYRPRGHNRIVHALSSFPFLPDVPDKDLDYDCQRLSVAGAGGQSPGADTDSVNATADASLRSDHPASATRVREERLRAWVEYQDALGPGGGIVGAGKQEAPAQDGENGAPGGKGDVGGGRSRSSDRRETDRGSYREYGGIGVLMLDVWANQPWRLDERGMATAKGGEEGAPGFHPKALLSKR